MIFLLADDNENHMLMLILTVGFWMFAVFLNKTFRFFK